MLGKRILDRANGGISSFRKNEDGGILLLSLLLFFGMTIFGGIAVDLANYERTRTAIQSHLDNAVLAAASLSQDLDPEQVVRSYLTSAGFDSSLVNVDTSTEEIGGILVGRTVEASLVGGLDTFFFHFFDMDSLGIAVVAQATERVEDIEISLVLDVSGSMDWTTSSGDGGRKIELLKQAASSFVESVLSEAEEDRVSISIIPYSTKVNAGSGLLSQYSVTQEHEYSNCVDFDASDYRDLSISPSMELQRTGHFQFQGWSLANQSKGEWVCRIDPGFEITPLSNSISDLKAHIARLSPEGSTSIDMGAKWGLALLDPSAQRPISGLISTGNVDPAFSGRPHPHGADNNLKVLVIMTDGKNDDEYRLRSDYAEGESDVIRTTSQSGSHRYYNVDASESGGAHDGEAPYGERYFYASHPFGSDRMWDRNTLMNNPALAKYKSQIVERRLTWPEVWAEMSPVYYGYYLYGRRANSQGYWQALMWDHWENMRFEIGPNEKDNRLRDICAAARRAGVVTYTIGMEVESRSSLDLLQGCASTQAHYFDVDGLEINTAFDMIAASISMLRLTK